ncbi:MAG: 2-amino-4-hydroxy-6-hydroxymethyldihydropteridine diphosphokinase [Planctomycetota bacterium]
MPTDAAIGLGSNLGDRTSILSSAVDALRQLPGTTLTAVSPIIETSPVGPQDQPNFLNAVAIVRTTLTPRQLLDELLAIERRLGRDRSEPTRWGPRVIDLDLLLHGEAVIDEPGLTLPHPHMHERHFVLEPLAAVLPDAWHPLRMRTIAELLGDLRVQEH